MSYLKFLYIHNCHVGVSRIFRICCYKMCSLYVTAHESREVAIYDPDIFQHAWSLSTFEHCLFSKSLQSSSLLNKFQMVQGNETMFWEPSKCITNNMYSCFQRRIQRRCAGSTPPCLKFFIRVFLGVERSSIFLCRRSEQAQGFLRELIYSSDIHPQK